MEQVDELVFSVILNKFNKKNMQLKRLYFDIETSPNIVYSWRVGYKLQIGHDNIINERAIICICYKWEGSAKVHSLKWNDGCDKEMLKRFVDVANQAHEIVAHNGDRFDIKWMRTRLLYHRIPDISNFTSIDTLKDARSRFLFNSNRLDYIGQFLGVGKKIDTGGFSLWTRVMAGDKKALREMVDYCKGDVELTERVYQEIHQYTVIKSNKAVLDGGERWQCPQCSSTQVYCNKTRATKMGTIKREMNCKNCKRNFTISNKSYMDYVKFKRLNK
jgi:DNA polymerase elongation subunit (family B)